MSSPLATRLSMSSVRNGQVTGRDDLLLGVGVAPPEGDPPAGLGLVHHQLADAVQRLLQTILDRLDVPLVLGAILGLGAAHLERRCLETELFAAPFDDVENRRSVRGHGLVQVVLVDPPRDEPI